MIIPERMNYPYFLVLFTVTQEGGQCSCRDRVEGRQCDRCKLGNYNLVAANPVGCETCGCVIAGTVSASIACNQTTGQCNCKLNVEGKAMII